MSVTVYKSNQTVFYLNGKILHKNNKKNTIIRKYNIPIEDKRTKIKFTDNFLFKPTNVEMGEEIPQEIQEIQEIQPQFNVSKKRIKFHISFNKDSSSKSSSNKLVSDDRKDDVTVGGNVDGYGGGKCYSGKVDEDCCGKSDRSLELSAGKLKQLKFGHMTQYENVEDNRLPFICKVEKRFYSSKTNKYLFQVSDGDKESYIVNTSSQMVDLIKNNIVKPNDFIKVNYYTATNISNEKPRVVIFVEFEKL